MEKLELQNRDGIIRLVHNDYDIILPDGDGLIIVIDDRKIKFELVEAVQ